MNKYLKKAVIYGSLCFLLGACGGAGEQTSSEPQKKEEAVKSKEATKKEKGRNPARPRLRWKLSIISGTSGPSILVRNEITKKIRNTSPTIRGCFLFFMIWRLPLVYR